ncbi:MAG: hypothetical protein V1787_00435 [Candidatus Micrarchaeota archaeon]
MRAVFASLLLAFLAGASSLSEYNYLLPEVHVSFVKLASLSSNCRYVSAMDLDGLPVLQGAGFAKALAHYDSARTHLRHAKLLASVQDVFHIAPHLRPLVVLGCHYLAVDALNEASSAARAGLEALDSRFAEFEALQDESDDFAQGVRNEIRETERHLLSSSSDGTSLGQRMVSSSSKLRALSEDYLANIANLSVLQDLAGPNSVLACTFSLARRIDESITGMWQASRSLGEALEVARLAADAVLARIKQEELADIPEEAYPYIYGGIFEPSSGPVSFKDGVRALEEDGSLAKLVARQADDLLSARSRGYLGRAVVLRRRALAILEGISDGGGELMESASSARMLLEGRSAREEAEVRLLAEGRRGEPVSYAVLQSMLSDFGKMRVEYASKNSAGARITHLLAQLVFLGRIREACGAQDAYAFAHSEAEGAAQRLGGLLAGAEKDGIDVTAFRQRLSTVASALGRLSEPSEGNYAAVRVLSGELLGIEEGLRRAAFEEFASVESDFAFAEAAEAFLSAGERDALSAYSGFFHGGKLDPLQAVGRLKPMRVFLSSVRAGVEKDKGRLIQGELEGSMLVQFSAVPTEPGARADVEARVSFGNSLPFESPEKFYVALPFNASDARVVNASPGLSVESGQGGLRAVFSGVIQSDYSVAIAFSAVPSRIVAMNERASAAGLDSAEKAVSVSIDSSLPLPVLFRIRAPPGSNYSVSSSAPYGDTFSKGWLELVLDAASGRTDLEITFFSANPFEHSASRTTVPVYGLPVRFDYALHYRNVFSDLGSAELRFDDSLPCEILSANASFPPELKASVGHAGGMLWARLSSGAWREGEARSVALSVECAGFSEDAFRLKLAELDERLASVPDSPLQAKLSDAKSLALDSRWEEALEAAYEVEQSLASMEGAQPAILATPPPASDAVGAPASAAAWNPAGAEGAPDSTQAVSELLENFSASRTDFSTAIEEYSRFFSSSRAGKPALAAAAAAEFKSASAALKQLDAVANAVEKDPDVLGRQSAARISSFLASLQGASSALYSYNSEIREMALDQAEIARSRVGQFGGEEDRLALEAIDAGISQELYLDAYLAASEISARLVPRSVPSNQPDYLWLAPVGLAALAGTALARNRPRKVEL